MKKIFIAIIFSITTITCSAQNYISTTFSINEWGEFSELKEIKGRVDFTDSTIVINIKGETPTIYYRADYYVEDTSFDPITIGDIDHIERLNDVETYGFETLYYVFMLSDPTTLYTFDHRVISSSKYSFIYKITYYIINDIKKEDRLIYTNE